VQGEQLFDVGLAAPTGFRYAPEFLTQDEEFVLIQRIKDLPLKPASYKQYTAKRFVLSYGGSYDFTSNRLLDAEPIPLFLYGLRERLSKWAGIAASDVAHAVIAKYETGTQLGWHRDVPDFEDVVGVSLCGFGRLRFRRYPHKKGIKSPGFVIDLAPRSAYILRDEARWGWQHSISPTKALRYSITFRSRRRAWG
jgi:alkylated DNA repair dioxygenase AlkB